MSEEYEIILIRTMANTGYTREQLEAWVEDPELLKQAFPQLCLWQRHIAGGLGEHWANVRPATRLQLIQDAYLKGQCMREDCLHRNDRPDDSTQCVMCIRMKNAGLLED